MQNLEPIAALLAAVATVLTLVVVLFQTRLFQDQRRLMRRQDELLHRRAKFVIWASLEQEGPNVGNRVTVNFTLVNVGDRAAQDATLILKMPKSFDRNAMYGLPEPEQWDETPEEDAGFQRWTKDVRRLFFVAVPVKGVATLKFFPPTRADGENALKGAVRYKIAYGDDGEPHRAWRPLTTREDLPEEDEALLRGVDLPAP